MLLALEIWSRVGSAVLAGSSGFGAAGAELLLDFPSPPAASSKPGSVGIFVIAALGGFFFAFALMQLKNAETNLASHIYFHKVPECPGCFANYLQIREIFSHVIKGNKEKAACGSPDQASVSRAGAHWTQPLSPGLQGLDQWPPVPGDPRQVGCAVIPSAGCSRGGMGIVLRCLAKGVSFLECE